MKIGVLGTGIVGRTLGTKLVANGHQVMLGARSDKNEQAMNWMKATGKGASHGTFASAAVFGELLFNCTSGLASLEALQAAGKQNLAGKILIDVANPLDFSKGMPPTLTICNTDSLGEQIQRYFPDTKVVKALNTVNCGVMVQPALVPGDHDLLVCGNDGAAKQTVIDFIAKEFGWKKANVRDVGGIGMARGTEMYLALWIRLYGLFGHPHFNLHFQIGKA